MSFCERVSGTSADACFLYFVISLLSLGVVFEKPFDMKHTLNASRDW